MSLFSSREAYRRRGIIAPLAAVLMVFLLGMVAFTVDIAWMVLAQTELQNVADAAALAGSQPLMDQYVNYSLAKLTGNSSGADAALATALKDAKAQAQKVAAANVFAYAGSKKNYVLATADIEFGNVGNDNTFTPAGSGVFPNTIRVTMRRTPGTNEPVSLFFGPVLGASKVDMANTASATVYGAADKIDSIQQPGALLPVTFDQDFWDKFWKDGANPDGTVSLDANGVPKLLVYPTNKYKGNFGLLSLDDSHTGSSEIKSWIDNGISQDELNTLINHNLIPVSNHDKNTWDWCGENGFKSTVVQTVNEHVNTITLMPLFKAKNGYQGGEKNYQPGVGQGSNYDYNIIGFAPVKIVAPNSFNKEIYIQPTAYIASDETVLQTFKTGGKLPPLDTSKVSASLIFTYPKLTQ